MNAIERGPYVIKQITLSVPTYVITNNPKSNLTEEIKEVDEKTGSNKGSVS